MISNDKKYPKRILIVGYRILNWLYILIIPILRNRFSTKFLVIAPLGVKNDFMKVLNKEDEFLIYDDQLEDMCSHGFNKDLGKEEKIAREIEKKYSINYMRDIIQQDRSLSASFLSYSPKYIWNKSRLSNNQNLIKLVNGYVKYTEEIIEKYQNIDMAFVWPVDGLSATMSNIFESRGVKVTYPYNSKYKSFGFWVNNAFQDSSKLEKSFKNTRFKQIISEENLQPPETGWTDTRKMDNTFSTKSLLKNLIKTILFRVEFLLIDLIKFDFTKKKRISLLSSLSFHINSWSLYRTLGKISERSITSFDQKPFLFYALPLEPEFSVQARCKEFNDQKSIIKLLALNMPAGYDLVIKEHSDIGRRDKSFYTELLKLPNIKMAHPSLRGIDLVKKARSVATMAGTVSLEATMMGKRVIEFSLHSSFSFLNNIFTVKEISKLKDIVSLAMENLDNNTKEKIRQDGSRLPEAIMNISFEAENTPLFYGNNTALSKKELNKSVDLLIETFNE